MSKNVVSFAIFALIGAGPSVAQAQGSPGDSSCPPGSWFCAEPPGETVTPAGKPVQPLEPLPGVSSADDEGEAPPPPSATARPRRRALPPPPPVVVYEPPPPPAYRAETPSPYAYAPPPPGPGPHEWGLNLHVEGASFGRGTGGNAGMGGAGLGVRYKPTRRFGIEGDIDFLGGNDYQGAGRGETAFTVNGLVFLNPRSRAQVYLLGGFGWSAAHVWCDANSTSCTNTVDTHYSYFGGQLGVGLELRLARSFALMADLRGFLRTRTDDKASSQPEFTDAYGRATNTSAGALVTGGMVIYF